MISKKEVIWRFILHSAFVEKNFVFTQKDIAGRFSVSVSTVHNALKLPRLSGAIFVTGRNFRVTDKEKFLLMWATHRNLTRDIIYQTRVEQDAARIEGMLPPPAIFAAYSAFREKYRDAPAEYEVVYAYAAAEDLPIFRKRFPPADGSPTLVVLEADPALSLFGAITPDVQTFVDLWNLPHWYAKDFRDALKEKLNLG